MVLLLHAVAVVGASSASSGGSTRRGIAITGQRAPRTTWPLDEKTLIESAKKTSRAIVIDEGYGIRASDSERVFLPFTRSRQPQIMGEFGYGLSLYLCKNEVEAMNGRIWFESEEGTGTTFSIKLPGWREASGLLSSLSEG